MERIDFEIKVYGNIVEITPKDGVKDNSIYEIKLDGVSELYGFKELDKVTVKCITALTPSYSTIPSVNSLVESCLIPDDKILYHIREASRYVDYIRDLDIIDKKNIPFEVEQYVRYKAAHDSILNFYIDKISTGGDKGTLGEVTFENQSKFPDISKLLGVLKAEAKRWEDALRGYKIEGRVKPGGAVRGLKANPQLNHAGLSYSRGV
jgi:hypothetical protein